MIFITLKITYEMAGSGMIGELEQPMDENEFSESCERNISLRNDPA